MKSEKGFSTIEVLIATLLLGMVGVAFLGGLTTAHRAVFITDERATAESLARTQMEYVKAQDYISNATQATYLKIADSQIPEGYIICSLNYENQLIEDIVYAVSWNVQTGQPAGSDTKLQKVSLVIKHLDKQIITLEGFKVNR